MAAGEDINSDRETLPSPSVSACACNAVASSRVVPVATANSSTDNCSLPSVSAAMKCSAALVNNSSSVTGISSGETAGCEAAGSGAGSGMTSCTGSGVTGTIGSGSSSGTGSGAGPQRGPGQSPGGVRGSAPQRKLLHLRAI